MRYSLYPARAQQRKSSSRFRSPFGFAAVAAAAAAVTAPENRRKEGRGFANEKKLAGKRLDS